MLVFNEGLPRSGKSYDVVKNHILPALASGRRVFARLNGMEEESKRQVIADYLKMPIERLNELLVHVPPSDVKKVFSAERQADGGWAIPDDLKNSLCVIDECHGFWVASTQPIHPASEEFFALIGQYGGDGVLMTQWYRRLHSSVRGRIERKNVFQKLTAVGMEGKYTVKRYHATSPERFEKVTTDTETYDSTIYPMYRGYAEPDSNTVVYKGGGQTVWRKLAKYALFVVPVVALAVWQLAHFFSSDSGLVKHSPAPSHVAAPVSAPSASEAYRATAGSRPVEPSKPVHAKMTDSQAYVFDLSSKGRPRLAGLVTIEGLPAVGMIEWREGDVVADRLDLAQIRDLGVTVEVHRYGVRLVVGKDSQVVTSWPIDAPAAPQAPPQSSEGQGRAVVSSAADATAWHDRQVANDYTPPELVKGPGLSSYSMH